MQTVRTVDEKQEALKRRKEDQKNLGAEIDRIIAKSKTAQDTQGCGGAGICPAMARGLMRTFGLSNRSAVSTTEIEAVAVSGTVSSSKAPHSRLFGAPLKKQTASTKLQVATDAMRTRLEALEKRAQDCRASAARQMKAGQKTSALRELKRAKLLEKQVLATTSAMDALESQSDMLEQTALQREVAAALGATAKTLKKDKTMLSKAEDAVDAASELRDLHEDMTQIMSSLGDNSNTDYDDEELLNELEEMVADKPPPPNAAAEITAESERIERMAREKEELERKHAQYEELEAMRSQMPSAPKSRVKSEKQSLLTGDS